MRFTTIAAIAAMVVSGSLFAQTVKMNDAKDWRLNKNITSKDGVLTVKGQTVMRGKNKFKVDPKKSYTLSMQSRTTGAAPVWCFFGVQCFDAKNRELSCANSNPMKGTEAVLAADLKKGAKKLVLKDAAKWPAKGAFYLVTGAKAKYADLPNFSNQVIRILKKEKKGASWEITIASPVRLQDAKAGTMVRLHRPGGYLYVGGANNRIGKNWVNFKGSIKGIAAPGVFHARIWPKGTVTARVIILSNWSKKNQDVQFQNVTLTAK